MICDVCEEELDPEERAPVRPTNAHRECLLRTGLGGIGHLLAHEYWCKQMHDPDGGLTRRQSALLVDAFVVIMGIPQAVDISLANGRGE